MNESGTDGAECSRKVASGKRVTGAIRPLVNARDLHLEWARVLHETLLVPLLTYGSEIMLWKEKEGSRIRAVQMDNLKGFLVFRRMDSHECRIRVLCGMKGLDERLVKACSSGSAMWRGGKMIGLPR